MRKINSLDQKVIKGKLENIFSIIQDFSTYNDWFPKNVNVKVIKLTKDHIGSKIKISYLSSEFYCEIIKIDNLKEIVVKYSGIHSGRGTWFFSQFGTGVKVMYEIDLEVKNIFVKFLSYFINFSEFHSKQMRELFSNLQNYLNNKFIDENTDLNSNGNLQPPTFTLSSDRFGT